MRAAMNRIAGIGAKDIVTIAPCKAPVSFDELIRPLESDGTVLPIWMPAYTRKDMAAMIMVHAAAGAGEGIFSPGQEPFGGL